MSIIISQKGINAKVVTRSDFENEDYLQNYIHKNPESIPLYDIAEDRKLFIVKREFPTNSGQIDALAIDQAGGLYIIETKLYKNPDKRLVVAQALDYGAALWKHLNDFD
jgi:RecB family endonuclease NucS